MYPLPANTRSMPWLSPRATLPAREKVDKQHAVKGDGAVETVCILDCKLLRVQLRNVHAVALHEAPQAKADHWNIEHERKPLAAHDEHEIEEKVERVVRHGDGVDLFADGDGVDLRNERRVVERSS